MLWLPRLEGALRHHLVPEQAGYAPKSGAIEALWTLTTLIDTHVSSGPGEHAYTCMADTSQAFDGVWRDGMYSLLYSYGVRGRLLRMIRLWHEGATVPRPRDCGTLRCRAGSSTPKECGKGVS